MSKHLKMVSVLVDWHTSTWPRPLSENGPFNALIAHRNWVVDRYNAYTREEKTKINSSSTDKENNDGRP